MSEWLLIFACGCVQRRDCDPERRDGIPVCNVGLVRPRQRPRFNGTPASLGKYWLVSQTCFSLCVTRVSCSLICGAVQVSAATGTSLLNALTGNPATTLTFLPTSAVQSVDVSPFASYYTQNNLAYFSSLGPAFDGRFKPDIVAPGEYIFSARATGGVAGANVRARCLSPFLCHISPIGCSPHACVLTALCRRPARRCPCRARRWRRPWWRAAQRSCGNTLPRAGTRQAPKRPPTHSAPPAHS